MRVVLVFVALITMALVAACGGGSGIPDDVEFRVIEDLPRPQFHNRIVKVRLNRKVSEETLHSIARQIKDNDPDYERIFIGYYIAGMDTDRAAWATTNFTPELKVIVQGLTEAQEAQFLAEPIPANREVVGRWISDQAAALSGLITIYVEYGTPFVERKLKAGDPLTLEAVEVASADGRRFNVDLGEYVVITPGGEFRYHLKDDSVFEKATTDLAEEWNG